MRLKALTLNNFGLYREAHIDFTVFKTNKVLILGENRDEPGLDSNGVGKTSIFEAISWALSGKTSKEGKIKTDDVIGPFGDQCKVVLELEGHFNLKIERKKGNKSYLRFWVNEEEKSTKGDIRKTQNNLLMYLGVAPDFHKNWFNDFMTMTYFSGDVARVFTDIKSTPSDKYSFISRYLSLEVLDLCKDNAKNKLSTTENNLRELETELNLVKSRIDGIKSEKEIKEEIDNLKRLISEKEQLIEQLKGFISLATKREEISKEIKNKQTLVKIKEEELSRNLASLKNSYDRKIKEYEEVKEAPEQLKNLEEELNQFDIANKHKELEELQAELNDLLVSKTKLSSEIFIIIQESERLENLKTHKILCPYCQSPLLVFDNEVKKFDDKKLQLEINKIKDEIDSKNIDLNNIKNLISSKSEDIQKLKKSIEQYQLLKNKYDLLEVKSQNLKLIVNEINDLVEQKESWEKTSKEYLESLNQEIKSLNEKLDLIEVPYPLNDLEFNIEEANNEIISYKSAIERDLFILEKLKEEKEKLKEIKQKISEIRGKLEGLKFAVEGFPTIKKWRIDDFIPQFRLETNRFLRKLNSDIKVLIDTDSTTKKGTIKDDFPIEAEDIYGKVRGLETFSNGEKSRISIAIAWALSELIKDNNYLPFEFKMMDEIADGLDSSGIISLSNLLDESNYINFVISHFNTFKDQFSESIKVIKENGESSLIINHL